MSGGGEVFADDVGEDPCGCPDAHRRHGGQDGVKREGLDAGQDLRPCLVDTGQHTGQLREDESGSAGAHNHDVLFIQGPQDLFREPVEHLRCELPKPCRDAFLPGLNPAPEPGSRKQ